MNKPIVPMPRLTLIRRISAPSSTWRLFRGLRIHLAGLLAGLFFVFYLITSILIYGLTARLTEADVDAVLSDTARPLAARITTALNRGTFPAQFVALAKLSQMYPKVSAIVLRDPQGNTIASTAPSVTRSLPYQSVTTTSTATTDKDPLQSLYRVLTVRLANQYRQTTGYLQVAIDVNRDHLTLIRLRHVLLLVGTTGILLAALAGFVLSKLSLRPAVRAWQLQEQFVADASHELRTPLTVMRLNLEVLNSQPDATIAENGQWMQSMEDEIHRLHRMTDQLLTLARTGTPLAELQRQPVDLQQLIHTAVDMFQTAASAKGLSIGIQCQTATRGQGADCGGIAVGQGTVTGLFTVMGDPDKLYQLITILVDNAIKYTLAGRIDLSLERRRHHVVLSVRDTGMGIDGAHLNRVFDRFYRTDTARTKGTGGTGLGLSIARSIATAHHGRISVHSTLGSGTTFIVSLPTMGTQSLRALR